MMSQPQDVVGLLTDLIALPSVNPEGDPSKTGEIYGEARVADSVERYFADLDVEVTRQIALAGRENVLVLAPGSGAEARPICLEAHMDTVDVEGMEAPFDPRISGGRIFGRGSCDTKASLAAMMVAMRRVITMGKVPSGGVCLLAAVDEERGHSGVKRFIEAELPCTGAIVGEPTALEVIPAHKGQAYFEIRAEGRAAHTSTPHYGINAIDLMSDVIQCLRRRSVEAYGARSHPLCGPSALTVSMIEGGFSEHVVPDLCRIRLDLRLVPGLELAEAIEEVQSWVREELGGERSARVEVIPPYKSSPGLDTPSNHPLVVKLEEASRAVLGAAAVKGVPYNTDGGYLSRAGIPAVVFGPGHIAQAHTNDEFVEIEQVEAAAEILTRALAT